MSKGIVVREIWCSSPRCNTHREAEINYSGTSLEKGEHKAVFYSLCLACGRKARNIVTIKDFNALIKQEIYA